MARWSCAIAALVAALALPQAPAEAADFYRDKQINIVVSTNPATGFDTFARMIGRYLPKYISGNPAIVVQNMPGAGGLVATNWLYNLAPRDGLTIGLINTTIPFDPLYGEKQARFVANKFNWLGSPSKETGMLLVWHTVPVDSIANARNRQLILAATGVGSTPAFFARVLASIFDLNVKIIAAYKSQPEGFLAMERGENDGNASTFWSSLTSEKPDWIRDKKVKVLAYYGLERDPKIPGPYVFDLITDPEKKAIMEVAQAGLGMGRPLLAPPNLDPEKVAILRAALEQVFKDPAYLAECARAQLDCHSPSSSAELLALVHHIYDQPRSAIEKVATIYKEREK